jgi:hypothetical protein
MWWLLLLLLVTMLLLLLRPQGTLCNAGRSGGSQSARAVEWGWTTGGTRSTTTELR